MVRLPGSSARPGASAKAAASALRVGMVKLALGQATTKRGATVNWVAGAVALAVALSSLAFPLWLVRREAARWRRFRQAHGEPEVVARRVAAKAQRANAPPLRLLLFRSSTTRWEPAGDGGSRRQSSRHEREPARRRQRRPRGNPTVSCWPAIVLML